MGLNLKQLTLGHDSNSENSVPIGQTDIYPISKNVQHLINTNEFSCIFRCS